MKVIVSWRRRGRNCWRSTLDVATDQLRSLKSWRSLNRHRCLVNLQPRVSVANYPISARLHLIPPSLHDEFSAIHYTVSWKSDKFSLRSWTACLLHRSFNQLSWFLSVFIPPFLLVLDWYSIVIVVISFENFTCSVFLFLLFFRRGR